MNKLQFPAASPSSRPPHTPQVCRLPPGLLPSHRSSPTTTPRFPAAGIRPLHTHLHSGSPPPPRAPPRPDSPASPRPRARAHTHTFSRFPNLLPRTETSQLRGNSARPAEGIGTQECARSAPSRRASRSPRLPAGKREDTATPPPPRTYHLCVCCSVAQMTTPNSPLHWSPCCSSCDSPTYSPPTAGIIFSEQMQSHRARTLCGASLVA